MESGIVSKSHQEISESSVVLANRQRQTTRSAGAQGCSGVEGRADKDVGNTVMEVSILLGCFHIAGRVEIALSMKVPYVRLLCYHKKGDRH